ncbi:MAG: hypothetical protein CMC96_14105 [Flavobacteriales bacterium]|nr:hypothetical protein [Flavobacteriales bacterium]|tara:strand:+ start:173 stop:1213 length:1041 start_codon:yes stop_codon:yes gene_type:complete
MRVIKKTIEQTTEHYNLISEYETKFELQNDVEKGLSSIFLISQNIPLKSVSDFFSGENFSMIECFEELEASYHLIKYGFYKQSMISLRTSLEIGLLSIYWSILGKESVEFKQWLSSKFDTPYKSKEFWEKIKSNENIKLFDEEFSLIEEIKEFGLSDFVHTKGIWYSNFGEFQRKLKGQDKFENYQEWLTNFKDIVRILEVLHLLRFPTLNIRFSTDYLLSKFGTFDSIPQFGSGFGNEMDNLSTFIPKNQLTLIHDIANSDEEVIEIKKWINELPELTKEEIRNKIIDNQKRNIQSCGFESWSSNLEIYDSRINSNMIQNLRKWAISKNFMTIENIIKTHKKSRG